LLQYTVYEMDLCTVHTVLQYPVLVISYALS
jgi:hypothetical protein